ncbi:MULTISPECIES: abortive infection family protein [unclassified Dysgonomonas]|uniref:abortive infection family protein n=1 Tax=unclassified Dysgonomonas TaxID=2630389 RepID=UPI0025C5BB29|nr:MULTISPECIES: abortive infection family protein [unclassified Dysgonomonas]
MKDISPKYQMTLIKNIESAIWSEYKSYKDVKFYIEKWYKWDYNNWENFPIVLKESKDIDLVSTLHGIDGETLLRIAIDLGVETPDFIPSIPVFRNEIKSNYPTASRTFEDAFKQIEEHPDIAIGLVNSALESIVKEILKDERVKISLKGSETLYSLVGEVLKFFQLYPNSDIPKEIKTIGSSLLSISKGVEELRSSKTKFHGKTDSDYIINDSIYAYFVVNTVTTVGLFLKNYFEKKFSPPITVVDDGIDDLPF